MVTNDASRSPEALAAVYAKAGLEEITEDKIISSGMLAREYLDAKVKSGRVAFLGTKTSAHYITNDDLETVPVEDLDLDDVDSVNALVFLDDEGFDWSRALGNAVNLLRFRNIPVIVANTDATYPESKREVSIAVGSMANMIEGIVERHFIRFGKPDAQMFHFAFEHIQRPGRPIPKREILMVGDTLQTDILGGNHFGIDTTLVLTGNTTPRMVEPLVDHTGILPDFVCESVVD